MKASQKLMEVLDTARFPGMSGKMRGIVRCILGRDDGFAELAITSDGFLMGRLPTDSGMNEFLGDAQDLERNWDDLLNVTAGSVIPLTDTLRKEAELLYQTNIRRSNW